MLEIFGVAQRFGDGFNALARRAINDAGLVLANQFAQSRVFFRVIRDLPNELISNSAGQTRPRIPADYVARDA